MSRQKIKISQSKTNSKVRVNELTTNFEKLRLYQYKLLLYIKKGHYAKSISRQMRTAETTIQYRIKRLLVIGLIKVDVKSSATFYKLTKKGYMAINEYKNEVSRYPRQKKSRLHRLNVKFKILKDNETAVFDREHELNNWIQKYTTVKFPIGVTIKKTSKSIIAMFHEFETDNSRCMTDFFNHVLKGTYYVYYYCMKRLDIKIDLFDIEVIDQHLVNEAPELKGKIDKSKTTTIGLNRKAKSFFKTNLKAKAWLDHSKGLPEIETNDFLYEEKLLAMPENMDRMMNEFVPVVKDFTEQIKIHMEVLKDIRDALKDFHRKPTG